MNLGGNRTLTLYNNMAVATIAIIMMMAIVKKKQIRSIDNENLFILLLLYC